MYTNVQKSKQGRIFMYYECSHYHFVFNCETKTKNGFALKRI